MSAGYHPHFESFLSDNYKDGFHSSNNKTETPSVIQFPTGSISNKHITVFWQVIVATPLG